MKYLLIFMPILALIGTGPVFSQTTKVEISATHPAYWMVNGKNTLLLGGSNEDNLFQVPYLQTHLDSLKDVGGNYVRCTMSSRDPGNVWPFYKRGDGLYDLNRYNKEYWERFEEFLAETDKKGIVVQLEVWATFDFYRQQWLENPFNPKNNVNYEAARTKLKVEVNSHPIFTDNDFFRSVPLLEGNLQLLGYQQKFVDKLLAHSLRYGHVLYCMDNETSVSAAWGRFWSAYIKKIAAEQGKSVYTTEMWDPHDLGHIAHRETFDHPEIYDFADISQNNHKSGEEHWENGLKQIARIANSGKVRPLNNVKIYGNDGGRHQTTKNAIESFCRNLFFGAASARFHRPNSGQGLNGTSQKIIGSFHLLSKKFDFFEAMEATKLLTQRENNEAYCRAILGKVYAVYFTENGAIDLDLSTLNGKAEVSWINLEEAIWRAGKAVKGGGKVNFQCPEDGEMGWLLLVKQSSLTKK